MESGIRRAALRAPYPRMAWQLAAAAGFLAHIGGQDGARALCRELAARGELIRTDRHDPDFPLGFVELYSAPAAPEGA